MQLQIDSSPTFKKLELYKFMLQVLYNNGKILANAELSSQASFLQLLNAKSKTKLNAATVREFIGVVVHLNIVYVSGKKKFISSSYLKAIETIDNYIPLEEQ